MHQSFSKYRSASRSRSSNRPLRAGARLRAPARWLGRNGVAASARVFDFPEGNDPVDKLWDYGADFMVAGAYGHTRLREWVFGGFTDSILKRSTRCAFLSH